MQSNSPSVDNTYSVIPYPVPDLNDLMLGSISPIFGFLNWSFPDTSEQWASNCPLPIKVWHSGVVPKKTLKDVTKLCCNEVSQFGVMSLKRTLKSVKCAMHPILQIKCNIICSKTGKRRHLLLRECHTIIQSCYFSEILMKTLRGNVFSGKKSSLWYVSIHFSSGLQLNCLYQAVSYDYHFVFVHRKEKTKVRVLV